MIATLYNKIHNENDLTKKKRKKKKKKHTQTNGMYVSKLVIKQDM